MPITCSIFTDVLLRLFITASRIWWLHLTHSNNIDIILHAICQENPAA